MLASVVIRTYNEEKYLDRLLTGVMSQESDLVNIEVIVIDSGSTDNTLQIAKKHNCRITHIRKQDFTFGRSLNMGCEFARGDFLIFVSGHCFPTNNSWVHELVKPLVERKADYSYGRQEGAETTKYSELQHFKKFFPEFSNIPQQGYFCNNANAAITRKAWQKYKFDEGLTGLEDMFLAKQLVNDGGHVAYVATASVYHIHDETWQQVRTRYEREAYALQKIMPEIHFTKRDFFRFFMSSLLNDFSVAVKDNVFSKKIIEIFMFRLMLYWGTYRGNQEVRQLSTAMKHRYFYPTDKKLTKKDSYEQAASRSSATNESE